jgi:VIT1/CCC1 family predicted Fe2+/Mn2+ transporter
MKASWKVGFSFGLTSGVIATLGLMVGLNASTQSKLAVVGGVLVIALADAMADALGIHVSEESDHSRSTKEVWESTIATFLAKVFFATTFVVPVLVFELSIAVLVSVIWGLLLIGIFSYYISKKKDSGCWKVIAEHLSLTIAVIIASHAIGVAVRSIFG